MSGWYPSTTGLAFPVFSHGFVKIPTPLGLVVGNSVCAFLFSAVCFPIPLPSPRALCRLLKRCVCFIKKYRLTLRDNMAWHRLCQCQESVNIVVDNNSKPLSLRALLHRGLFWCSAALRCLTALLFGSSWFQQASLVFTLVGGSLTARAKLGPLANLRRRCVCFGTNPPAGETVTCVKALLNHWQPCCCRSQTAPGEKAQVAMAPLGSAAPRCTKTAPCVKAP